MPLPGHWLEFRWKAAIPAHQTAVHIDPFRTRRAFRMHLPERERPIHVDRSNSMQANPDEAIRIISRHGNPAIDRDGPGAVVEAGIGPARSPARVVAEVVAHGSYRLGLLRMTQQPCRACRKNCEKDQHTWHAGKHGKSYPANLASSNALCLDDRPPGSYPKTGVMSGLATTDPKPKFGVADAR
jgi:hypothetical protein